MTGSYCQEIYYSSDMIPGVGMFGATYGSTIKNIVTEKCYFNKTRNEGNCGTIAGNSMDNSTVSDCINTGDINSTSTVSSKGAGGIAGRIGYKTYDESATVSNCVSTGTVTITVCY